MISSKTNWWTPAEKRMAVSKESEIENMLLYGEHPEIIKMIQTLGVEKIKGVYVKHIQKNIYFKKKRRAFVLHLFELFR